MVSWECARQMPKASLDCSLVIVVPQITSRRGSQYLVSSSDGQDCNCHVQCHGLIQVLEEVPFELQLQCCAAMIRDCDAWCAQISA